MYNKAKRILSLIAGIMNIVIGSLMAFTGLLNFIQTIGLSLSFIVGTIVGTGMGVPLIIFGAQLCVQPKKINGVWTENRPARIVCVVMMSLTMLYTMLGSSNGYGSILNELIYLLVYLISTPALALNIVSMCLKSERKPAPPRIVVVPQAQSNYVYPGVTPAAPPSVFPEYDEPQPTAPTAFDAPTAPAEPRLMAKPKLSAAEFNEKVTQLKEWKDEGVITTEQYDAAIEKLMNQYLD